MWPIRKIGLTATLLILIGCTASARTPLPETFFKITTSLVSRIPVTRGALFGGGEEWHVLYSVALTNLSAGTLVEASGEVELTSDASYPVSLVAKIVKGRSALDTEATGAEVISGSGGENLVPDVHHGLRQRQGEFIADQDYPIVWVNFVVRAVSSAALPGDQVFIAPGSELGRFVVKVSTPNQLSGNSR